MGKVRIAQVLARAGLHLSATTVARMLETAAPRTPEPTPAGDDVRYLHSDRPNHIWHVDLTTVPTARGFWVAWLPWSLPQRWPSCWWVAVVVDHFSRRIVGVAVFTQNPTSVALRRFLGRVIRDVRGSPSHLITDYGTQFTDGAFRAWCHSRDLRQHFGAVGQYGSIAVVERVIRTMKNEAILRILVPLDRRRLCRELGLFVQWYNAHRPHSALEVSTPDELYFQRRSAAHAARFEPRRHWPRGSPCAGPQAAVRGRPGQRIHLHIACLGGRRHLPIIELVKAA